MLSIYYSKTNGEIYTVTQSSNKQGYERFGYLADDMALIFNILYMEDNEYLMMNSNLFRIVDGEVRLREEVINIKSSNNSDK